jgi:hypothetical protein
MFRYQKNILYYLAARREIHSRVSAINRLLTNFLLLTVSCHISFTSCTATASQLAPTEQFLQGIDIATTDIRLEDFRSMVETIIALSLSRWHHVVRLMALLFSGHMANHLSRDTNDTYTS